MKRPLHRAAEAANLPWMNDDLVRAELFGAERLEQHAESLARAQPVTARAGAGRSLAGRLRDDDRVLRDAHRALARALAAGQSMSPAAQWLVDNYHVIEVQVWEIRADLPAGYYRQLPKLAGGPFAGYPRVLGLAWAFVAHTDSRFDAQTLCRFVRAYQQVQPLTIGELWAVAITLRIVLVENLRRAATRIMQNRAERERADAVANAILDAADGGAGVAPPSLIAHLPPGPMHTSFAVQLVARLREQDPAVTPALRWLEEQLAAQGTTADAIVQEAHQNQAAMSVTVRNVITSMRMISTVDWVELFESVSLTDALLREGSDFAQMDFATRNSYRTAIEELARGAGLAELDVTREVLRAAASRASEPAEDGIPPDGRRSDPGYDLVGAGRFDFEAAIGCAPPLASRLRRALTRLGLRFYLGAVGLSGIALVGLATWGLAGLGLGLAWLVLFVVLAALPAADLAVALVNRLLTFWLHPAALPGLALRAGVPAELRTIVVVPTLLTSPTAIGELIERLEIHHLASPDGELFFALLTDWTDADTETAPTDNVLLAAAAEGIAGLNRRYPPPPDQASGARFLLLHRRRTWNATQGSWMGWERKRGKLDELNRLLRGATDTSFIAIGGAPPAVPDGVRYVITLDSDTRLPREAVRRMIGKMAHPLNRPYLDPALGRVVQGYGILQPRVTPSLPLGGEGSLFQRAFSSAGGIDPYVAATSDVYQDLFGEGSYAGKGIYDVDVFAAALAGRVPDNTLLSHDLFEGIFTRAGLASDIEVVEEFPPRYDVAISRQHRWTRGDWQLLPWIVGRRGRAVPAVGRWKMLDNLRRSATPPALLLALLVGWQFGLAPGLLWTGFLLLTLALPPLLPVFAELWPRRARVSLPSHLRMLGGDLKLAGLHLALVVTLLAEQAAVMTDAIGRTLLRLFLTRRRLLEWTTAEQSRSGPMRGVVGHYRRMAGSVIVAVATAADAALAPPLVWIIAAPFALLWLLAPAVAWWASRAPAPSDGVATAADLQALRLIARRTWRFFETFVTPADNMLPPDNFQEDPKPVVAHRTSPTNIGLYLLSLAAARDFGWLGLTETVERLEATFATLDRMERIEGHFLNWYDTTDLHSLLPTYVSSVDSGNLAGHLIALANACDGWNASPADAADLPGVADALTLAGDALRRAEAAEGADLPRCSDVAAAIADVTARLAAPDAEFAADRLVDAAAVLQGTDTEEVRIWAAAARATLATITRPAAPDLPDRLAALAGRAREMAQAMRFAFLLDPERKLLSIGYLPADGSLDPSCYDLLASEARLASFLAIAGGDAPVAHWFRLGRAAAPVGRGAALISWSGSMFEYLMPSLVMRAPTGSLLASTSRLIVRRQVEYATALGLPWGMSESAFAARDLELTYQYSNFGIPDLALKRGLGEHRVIAPYATALATMVEPTAAVRNFEHIAAEGGLGHYGYYEALDYTPARVPEGKRVSVVRAYMAHHQGMSIVAIANTVLGGIMRVRFHAEPRVKASELLLQERAPREVTIAPERAGQVESLAAAAGEPDAPVSRRIASPHGASPATHILSNGRYSVMITAAGAGYSRWQGRAVTRWREDATRDDWGSFVYLRDVQTDRVWSAGLQPSGREADAYSANFTEERVEISRRDRGLLTHLEIVVSAEDDAEVRRVTLTNTDALVREVELTSYMELVLAAPADDAAHPAFSKMFVQTEFLPDIGTLLATRRRRAPAEAEMWAAHLLVVEGETIGDLHVETDRAAFLGRGRGVREPAAMVGGRPLTGSVGTVLDPVFSLRRRVRIPPGAAVRLAFWTIVAESRVDVLTLADRHRDPAAFARAYTLAWTHAQVQLRHLGVRQSEAAGFQRLAGHLLYANGALRPPADVLRRGVGGQAGLWPHGISGDLPILLVRIDEVTDVDVVRHLLAAHEYWRMKQLASDLVILNEKPASYNQDLQLALDAAVRMGQTRAALAGALAQGSVFVLRADLIGPEAQALLLSVARVVLVARRGSLADQLARLDEQKAFAPVRTQSPAPPDGSEEAGRPAEPVLEFFNGLGGFAEDGREYVTILRPGQTTPAPWTNIVANDAFGFQITADGGGYTWWRNSRENQLTPWSNDPVGDPPGEAIYLRDEETGALWGPTPQPVRQPQARYEAHHGMGYSRFRAQIQGIETDLLTFVPVADPVKILRLTVRNTSDRARRLSVSWYVEWVLGPSRAASAAHIVTEHDGGRGAILATNSWNTAFGPIVGFAAMPGRAPRVSGDRREFIGRNGTLAWPTALARQLPLSGRVGAGLDPCGALQTGFELRPGESVEVVLLLGASDTTAEAARLIDQYAAADLDATLEAVRAQWEAIVGTVQVRTPDRSMDVMLNAWLLYQTLACRVWARAGFYQASGAFGFRDQLQDGMALASVRPDLTRAHLLRAAGRQFPEGDVQHWWLPPRGQGVRTRISDDRVWLAHAAMHYVTVTGDAAVLEEPVPFLDGRPLGEHEHDAYFEPTVSSSAVSLFEHCALGLDAALATGAHGLPLIGTGDWNDGLSRVGEAGAGESVWLGFFLYAALVAFAPVAERRGETARAAAWRAHAGALQAALEREAWDGSWYRRGYFDDGTPLGSVASSECRIDAIAQSWGVISGAAEPGRAVRAMAAMDEQLIRRHDGIALLFSPPFDRTPLDPGYIKGYPPGLRENGGQYTHAAIWSVIAYALQGEGERAAELFAMVNPVNHALSLADAHRYKVEPYAVAADIYAAPSHVGRGGWTWYTGSAGWMYRAGLEYILGLHREGTALRIEPCIPRSWPGYEIRLRHGAARYVVTVENPAGARTGIGHAWLDGVEVVERPVRVVLADDGGEHAVRLVLG